MTHPNSLTSYTPRLELSLKVPDLEREGRAEMETRIAGIASHALSTNLGSRDTDSIAGRTYSLLPLSGGASETLEDASRLYNEGNSFYEERKYSEALKQYKKSFEIYKRLAPNSLDLASSYDSIGNVYQAQGEEVDNDEQLEEALEMYEKSLAIREVQAPGSLAVAESYHKIGVLCGLLGRAERPEEELEMHKKSLAIREDLAPGSLAVAESYYSIGNLYETRGEVAFALELYEKSFAIKQRHISSDPKSPKINDCCIQNSMALARTNDKIGRAYESQSNLNEALASYNRSFVIYQILDPNSLDVARSCTSIGKVYEAQGNLPDALKQYQRSLEIREHWHKRVLGALGVQRRPRSDIAQSCSDIGDVFMAQGKFQEALELYQRGIEIFNEEGDFSWSAVSSYERVGCVYQAHGKLSEAFEQYKKTLEMEEFADRESPYRSKLCDKIGKVLLELGDYPAVITYANKGIQINPSYKYAYDMLGIALHKQGNFQEALAAFDQALRCDPGYADANIHRLEVIAAIAIAANKFDGLTEVLANAKRLEKTNYDQRNKAELEKIARASRRGIKIELPKTEYEIGTSDYLQKLEAICRELKAFH